MNATVKPRFGKTESDFVSVSEALPAQAVPVIIAYLFPGDEELTVDMGERDGDRWLYIGGGPVDGVVFFWAFQPPAPAIPGIAEGSKPQEIMELAA